MTKIRLRRGTAAQWTAVNPVLMLGEPGIETDTLKMKIGDGLTQWSSLSYMSGGGGGGGIEEVPLPGIQYVRTQGGWVPLSDGGADLTVDGGGP